MKHQICHVSVHKYLARVRTSYLVGGHAAVGAADPQKFGLLVGGQFFEVGLVQAQFFGCPGFISQQ